MIFNCSNPHEVRQMHAFLSSLEGKGCLVEVKRKPPMRSLAQNRYLHLILGYFGCSYGCSIEEAKIDFFKRECNRDIFEREATNRQGRTVKYLRSTTELDTKELNMAIERFRNWSSAVANIYLPSPNEEQFLAFCAQEMERDRAFI